MLRGVVIVGFHIYNTERGAFTLAPEPGRVTENNMDTCREQQASRHKRRLNCVGSCYCNYYESRNLKLFALRVDTYLVRENEQQYTPVL